MEPHFKSVKVSAKVDDCRLVGSIATRCAGSPGFPSKRRINKGAPFEQPEMSFDGGADMK